MADSSTIDDDNSRDLLELRRIGGNRSLQDQWLLAVQRRHEARGRGTAGRAGRAGRDRTGVAGRAAGHQRQLGRNVQRFADFSRFGLNEDSIGRAGIPEVVANEAAFGAQVSVRRSLSRPIRSHATQPSTRSHSVCGSPQEILTHTQFRSLLCRAQSSAGMECAICLQQIHSGEQIVELPCNAKHRFHATCSKEWLCGRSRRCPVCRKPVLLPARTNSLL